MRGWSLFLTLTAFVCVLALQELVHGQTIAPSFDALQSSALPQVPASFSDSGLRMEQLEQEVASLRAQLDSLTSTRDDAMPVTPAVAVASTCDACSPGAMHKRTHYVTYDGGWVLRPYDSVKTPYELKFNMHNQFRYTGFARSVTSFTDAAGNVRPIENRNDFDINRGRLVFSGYAGDPRVGFYTNVDYNTVANNPVLLLMSWLSFQCSDSLTVYAGLGKVPGTWEWIETSRFSLGAERTMATTFFRPSMTAGIWAIGEPLENVHYRVLVGDGFNTFTLRAAELDTNLVYSGSLWYEPLGEYGAGFSDLECHESLAVRIGNGLTFAGNDADPTGEPGPEQTLIRLSDGTRLVEPGALAPGVTVNEFDITLYAVHLGLKYRGWNLSTEYFLRWLSDLRGTGPLPVSSLFDHGFFAQTGFFVVPQRIELYALGSQVTGDFGSGTELGGGINCYLKGQRGARITADVTHIDDSPAQQDRTGLVAGASGTLFRVQFWSFF